MEETYEFKNKRYEAAVKELKASLFDVIVIEEAKLATLEKTATAKVDTERKEAEEQISAKETLLNQTLAIVSQLISNIEKLDSNHTAITKINTQDIAPLLATIGDKKVNETITKELASVAAENKTILNDIEKEIKETPQIPENTAIVLPDIREGATQTAEVAESSLKEFKTAPKIDQEELIKEAPELEAINNQLETLSAQEETIKNNAGSNPVKQQVEVLKFKKTTNILTKAILVRKEQLEKLAKSRIQKRAVLDTLDVFAGVEQFQQTQQALAEKKLALDTSFKESIEAGITGDRKADKERQIEDLMVKANVYYNAGETQKAQELYNQISKLNSTLKNKTGGEVLVKK